MLLIDAVTRWLPGVLGHAASAKQDSFTEGLLDCPHYTRPEVFEGEAVPEVLLSGDHGAIADWRRAQALCRTLDRRPDLLVWDEVRTGMIARCREGWPENRALTSKKPVRRPSKLMSQGGRRDSFGMNRSPPV